MKRKGFMVLAVLVLIAGAFGLAHAVPGYWNSFKSTYSTSPLTKAPFLDGSGRNCLVCHAGWSPTPPSVSPSVNTVNDFGNDYANNNYTFDATLLALDSDLDGYPNGQEITAGSFPGNINSIPSFADTTAPNVTAFTIPAASSTLTVAISSFTATDAVGVTGYMAQESSTAPAAGAPGWSATAPASYTFATAGAKTLYGFARDSAGNVSAPLSAATTITLPDTTAPNVTAFTMPASAASLTVSITSFTATDAVGVTGYMAQESSTAPAAGAPGWSATAPASYTFATAGAKTLYGFARDSAGNVSAPLSAATTITLPDTTAPNVTAFTIPAASSTLTVAISSFTATDTVGVTGYVAQESSTAPAAGALGWSATAPASYTFASAGAKTLYGFAKDAAGNVSAPRTASTTITLPDTIAPNVTAFTIPAASSTLTVAISSFTATDTVGVTGYVAQESSTAPAAGAAGWSATAPASYTFASAGAKTLYGFAKDAAGNVSAPRSAATTITLPDTTAPNVTAFAIPASASSLTVSITSFTATDDVAVTGYMVTGTSAIPAASAGGWTSTPPASYTFSAAGARTIYGWAKDAAGNVSVPVSATTTITLPDTTAPTVTSFTIPASSTSLTVSVSMSATDDVGVTGYLVTESSTKPSASAAGWSGSAPTSYTFASAGAKTLYGFAKDAAGNVSASLNAPTTITSTDVTAPMITGFTIPASSASLTVTCSLTATDDVGVTGYMVTDSSTAPLASASGWSGSAPTSYTLGSAGDWTVYAWAKDAAGNVSASMSQTITITLSDATAPTITSFVVPSRSSSLTVAITLAAADDVGVTGYLVTEGSKRPSPTASGWRANAPGSFTFRSAGYKALNAWAKDAAGNISARASRAVTVRYSGPVGEDDGERSSSRDD